ncbi:hypothetical protein O181_121285 [Austropuccinia psidii MF-1]|uniref:Uncharacterized protein n=1 Tax=Austropuccinia psidii MF-1 TaxID=1389203 RepID=A0A9Q3Q264_9BASI|nr:hypothetical protein [Austropuccinia psidii MF-1]
MNSYLHIKSFLGQEQTMELLGGWNPLYCKDKVKNIKNFLKNQSPLSTDQKKELEMTPALETEGPVSSTSSKPAPEVVKDKPKGSQKKQKGPKNNQGKGKGKANWHRPYPQGYRIPKLEPSAMESVLNMARTLMEFTAKEQEMINRTFSTQIIDEIHFFKSSMDVELGEFNAKLNKTILDISELKINDKYTKWYHLRNVKLDSITNTCDRIESKFQVQNDEMENHSILNIKN